MRLNEESIKYILDLQKNILPLIYCCANNERLRSLESIVNHYNGRLTYKNSYEYKESDLINTLLIFLDEINSDGVLDIEKALITMNKREIKIFVLFSSLFVYDFIVNQGENAINNITLMASKTLSLSFIK